LLKRILDIKKKIFSLEPKLLPKEEIKNRRANIFGFQGNLNYTITKEIEDFQTWNKENIIAPLKNLCGSNEFNNKYKELDEISKDKYNKLEEVIGNEWKAFQLNCYKEVEQFRNKVYGDSFKNYINYMGNVTHDYEVAKNSSIIASTFTGGITTGAILGLIFSSAIAIPVIGIIIGGLGFLGSFAFSLAFIKTQKTKLHELLEEYGKRIDNLKEFLKELKEKSNNIVKQCIEEIEMINDINMMNPKYFLENKDLFKKNIDNLMNFILK
jgi:NAD kinase